MKPSSKTNIKPTKPLSLHKGTTNKDFKVVEKEAIKPKQGFT